MSFIALVSLGWGESIESKCTWWVIPNTLRYLNNRSISSIPALALSFEASGLSRSWVRSSGPPVAYMNYMRM
jgi:hypothetical protein